MLTVPQALDLAVQQHQRGHLPQAEEIYRAILHVDPSQVDALHLLGVLSYQRGNIEMAIEYLGQALRLRPDCAEAHNNLGNVLKDQGKLTEAVASYRRALRYRPDYAEAHNNLGLALYEEGQLAQARASLQQALRLRPTFAEAHNNLGMTLKEQGQLEEAVACYEQALRLKPDYAKAHNNRGIALHEQGKLVEALACYQEALRYRPDYAEAHNNRGNVLKDQGKLAEAAASYQQALRYKPDYAEAHNNLGVALKAQGKLEEAGTCLQQALRLQPGFAAAHNNLGNVLREQGKLDEAVASFQHALRLRPDYAEAHSNLGITLQQEGKLDEAVASLQQALCYQPDSAEARNNLGNVLKDQGKLTEALACYEQALGLQPDFAEAHFNRALAWLLAGNFEQGWPEYEWRWQCPGTARPGFRQPLWNGSPLDGRTILLWAEQGWGDILHFIRYAPLVKERGGYVLATCPAALIPLLSRCPGIDRLLPQDGSLPPFEVYAPLLSLPRLFGTTLAMVPAQVPYLSVDPQLSDRWREALSSLDAFQIGIAWQGNPKHASDRQRSIPLEQFAPLAQLRGVELVSLQKGSGTEQLRTVAGRFPVTDLGSKLDTTSGAFVDTAAVMQQLDLVIAADTALAHLAGALGVPVWVALSCAADWRWLRQREDSPWYPSMRLFRQKEWGNWPEVFQRMVDAVKQLLARGGTPRPDGVGIARMKGRSESDVRDHHDA